MIPCPLHPPPPPPTSCSTPHTPPPFFSGVHGWIMFNYVAFVLIISVFAFFRRRAEHCSMAVSSEEDAQGFRIEEMMKISSFWVSVLTFFISSSKWLVHVVRKYLPYPLLFIVHVHGCHSFNCVASKLYYSFLSNYAFIGSISYIALLRGGVGKRQCEAIFFERSHENQQLLGLCVYFFIL